jgi:hypothetical protein
MNHIEALDLALKALRFARDDGYENEVSQEAITAIKQALAAQPAPEFNCPRCGHCCSHRQWQSLTDEDFENAFQETYIMGDSDLKDFAKVIEAKLREKNT